MICFFSGAPYLTITQMAAGLYTYPLFTVILAGPILKEKITVVLSGEGADELMGGYGRIFRSPFDFSNNSFIP